MSALSSKSVERKWIIRKLEWDLYSSVVRIYGMCRRCDVQEHTHTGYCGKMCKIYCYHVHGDVSRSTKWDEMYWDERWSKRNFWKKKSQAKRARVCVCVWEVFSICFYYVLHLLSFGASSLCSQFQSAIYFWFYRPGIRMKMCTQIRVVCISHLHDMCTLGRLNCAVVLLLISASGICLTFPRPTGMKEWRLSMAMQEFKF